MLIIHYPSSVRGTIYLLQQNNFFRKVIIKARCQQARKFQHQRRNLGNTKNLSKTEKSFGGALCSKLDNCLVAEAFIFLLAAKMYTYLWKRLEGNHSSLELDRDVSRWVVQ